MTEDKPKRASDPSSVDLSRLFDRRSSTVERLYARSQAARWGLTRERFAAALERSAKKHFSAGSSNPQELEEYLGSIHLEDLALAAACATGCESAWENFFATYRAYLRMAAAAILRCQAASAEACELADSLFTDLYGLEEAKGSERSLFRYFHGRSSLKTWLRAVLAQRHIDSIRAGRRFEELAEDEAPEASRKPPLGSPLQPADPHRELYVSLFSRALTAALDRLAPLEKDRLRLYYAEEKTLAEIGRLFGEHESSVSRHLERVRRDLRQAVEEILRRGFVAANGSAAQPGLSDAEIAVCFEYSSENTPIDLDKLLPSHPSKGPAAGKRPL
ncbi:MAG TPA: sigma-70 family RNA polymerase sigma factor [Candidatus Acidoferrum sp.]|jgi:RNA polymerase sigma-70 factor (ECF subfamily)|nr:sigma-70 family RNA polymerase sigma factor [Candidatus Acidoferrum sp.]